eukprot:1859623-Amphidinium_carterae.1
MLHAFICHVCCGVVHFGTTGCFCACPINPSNAWPCEPRRIKWCYPYLIIHQHHMVFKNSWIAMTVPMLKLLFLCSAAVSRLEHRPSCSAKAHARSANPTGAAAPNSSGFRASKSTLIPPGPRPTPG